MLCMKSKMHQILHRDKYFTNTYKKPIVIQTNNNGKKFIKKLISIITECDANESIYQEYYQNLKQTFVDTYKNYIRVIDQDLHRTRVISQNGVQKLEQRVYDQMRNVLQSLSKRNMEIGYCQGLNFFALNFFQQGFNEQQVFWILVYILENKVPKNYYTNMYPVLADLKMLKYILKMQNVKLFNFLGLNQIDINLTLFSKFLLIFIQIKNQELKNFIILKFLSEGVLINFKIVLVILNLIEQQIYSMEFPEQFGKIFDDFINNSQNNQKIYQELKNFYLDETLISLIRRQIIQKEYNKITEREKQIFSKKCEIKNPYCLRLRFEIGLKQKKNTFSTFNYLDNLKPNHFSPFNKISQNKKQEQSYNRQKSKTDFGFNQNGKNYLNLLNKKRSKSQQKNDQQMILRKAHICQEDKYQTHLIQFQQNQKEQLFYVTNKRLYRYLGFGFKNMQNFDEQKYNDFQLQYRLSFRTINKSFKRRYSIKNMSKNKTGDQKIDRKRIKEVLKFKKQNKKSISAFQGVQIAFNQEDDDEYTEEYIEKVIGNYKVL